MVRAHRRATATSSPATATATSARRTSRATEFRDDIVRAKGLLEDIGGVAVTGYRAPSFSIGSDNLWAFDCMPRRRLSLQLEHLPDPPRSLRHARRAALRVPRRGPTCSKCRSTTVELFNRNWPAGGGGWFRLLPYAVSRWLLRRVNCVDGEPCMFYFHPWEIDPAQPRVAGIDAQTRFRHYVNLDRMEARLGRLLADFRWDRVDRVFLHESR